MSLLVPADQHNPKNPLKSSATGCGRRPGTTAR